MSRHNILVISGFWPTQDNPISGIFVVQQIEALVALGVNVTVILERTFSRPSSPHLTVNELNLPVDRVDILRVSTVRLPERFSRHYLSLKMNSWLSGIVYARALEKLRNRKNEFHGVILHGSRYASMSLPKWRSQCNCNVIGVLHGVDPLLERVAIRRAKKDLYEDFATAVSTVVLVGTPLRKFASLLGIPTSKQKVVSNGTVLPSPNLYEPSNPENHKVKILSVSNLNKIKGIDHNLKALATIRKKYPELEFEYTIIGDGPEKTELKELSESLDLDDKVIFLGRLSYNETMLQMGATDIFSLPSWGEAFGIVYLEAMARGKPVIGCYENGAADIITNEVEGLLIPPQDVDALAGCLEKLILDAELRSQFGKNAISRAQAFSWKSNALNYLKLLELDK